MRVDIKQRSVGVNFNGEGQALIKVWSPEAIKVEILVIETGQVIPLEKKDMGYWFMQTDMLKPGNKYRILLDSEKEFPDPASLNQPDGVHGASKAIAISQFAWTDNAWNNIPLKSYIIYELHTGTFSQDGNFAGIETKLEYLKDLGINAIEIMPVAQFPGDRNWGYDGVYPFAVQQSYGGAEGLQRLVNACHDNGIAVILDVVYNHLGPEGNYLGAFGPYFTEKYKTPWGGAINFDDAWSDGVREYFIENALMWFRDFHIDALRLDAVHAIKDLSPVHILKEIKLHVDALMESTGRKHYLITELDLNDTRFINTLSSGGYGMDAQWIDEFHHALRVTAGGDRHGYYEDFDGIEMLAKAYKDAYVYDGQYSPHRKKYFGIKAEHHPGEQFIVFSQNHDQVGNRMLGERTSKLVSFEMQKLLAGAVMVSPFLPMLFMGEEWSEPNPFLYFVSHTDPELAAAVRKGRREEFAAFHAQGEAPDPVAEETFRRSKLQWQLLDEEKHQTLFGYYQRLIALRKSYPVWHHLHREHLSVEVDKAKNLLLLHRWLDDQYMVCLMNFSKTTQETVIPDAAKEWQKVLDAADTIWLGPKGASETVHAGDTIVIQPESILIYLSY